ncbi:MAG: lipoyl(octanoyl) transferase LipB [Planctomycetes bacterium]|nr:lipoyl(octanoyl) transferase LipB [Planctomycetota bacterium]
MLLWSVAPHFEIVDLGKVTFEEAEARQMEAVEERADGGEVDRVFLAEFEPVLTVGRGSSLEAYKNLDMPVVEVSRGGKATFHGPGQLVAYPVLGLEGAAQDLHAYLHVLEEVLIHTLGKLGLEGVRDERNTGCWVHGRKVASIGVAVKKWVTYHGLALNVSIDLNWFHQFDPCGLLSTDMTNLETELGHAPEMVQVKEAIGGQLERCLRPNSKT